MDNLEKRNFSKKKPWQNAKAVVFIQNK